MDGVVSAPTGAATPCRAPRRIRLGARVPGSPPMRMLRWFASSVLALAVFPPHTVAQVAGSATLWDTACFLM